MISSLHVKVYSVGFSSYWLICTTTFSVKEQPCDNDNKIVSIPVQRSYEQTLGVPGSNRVPPNGVFLYQPVLAATSRCMILNQGILPIRKHVQKMPQNRITAEFQVSKNSSPFEEFSMTSAFHI
jgi:hypothetical protein